MKSRLPRQAPAGIARRMKITQPLSLLAFAAAALFGACALDDDSQDPGVKTSDNTPFRSEPMVSDFYNSSYEESLYSPFSFN